MYGCTTENLLQNLASYLRLLQVSPNIPPHSCKQNLTKSRHHHSLNKAFLVPFTFSPSKYPIVSHCLSFFFLEGKATGAQLPACGASLDETRDHKQVLSNSPNSRSLYRCDHSDGRLHTVVIRQAMRYTTLQSMLHD